MEGQITDVIWNDNRRGDFHHIWNNKNSFYVLSWCHPYLYSNDLYVRWKQEDEDNKIISHTYETEKEAQEMLDFINEHTVKEETQELKEGDWCYVSSESEADALEKKEKRVFLHKLPWLIPYKYLILDRYYTDFLSWYQYSRWEYAVPIPKEEKKERKLMMTDSEWDEFQKKNNL